MLFRNILEKVLLVSFVIKLAIVRKSSKLFRRESLLAQFRLGLGFFRSLILRGGRKL